jgi:hypothetical protein
VPHSYQDHHPPRTTPPDVSAQDLSWLLAYNESDWVDVSDRVTVTAPVSVSASVPVSEVPSPNDIDIDHANDNDTAQQTYSSGGRFPSKIPINRDEEEEEEAEWEEDVRPSVKKTSPPIIEPESSPHEQQQQQESEKEEEETLGGVGGHKGVTVNASAYVQLDDMDEWDE